MVRYATGDLTDALTEEACSCGADTPRIGRIVGRVGEITKIRGMFLIPAALERVLQRNGVAAPCQVCVERDPGGQDAVVLKVACPPPPGEEQIVLDVQAEARIRIAVEWSADIPSDAGKLDDRRGTAAGLVP